MAYFRVLVLSLAMVFVTLESASAALVSINFDSAQANYTPLAQGVTQVVTNQFAPLGILFRNGASSTQGVVVGDTTGGVGSDPVHLYGNNGAGGYDTTPDINVYFVDPANSSLPGYTDFFRMMVTDGHPTTMTAYDTNGFVLGVANTTGSPSQGEFISLSGIGQISRINIVTPGNQTGYDDISFNEVQPLSANVPEPATMTIWAIGALGLAGAAYRRRKLVS